MRPTTTRRTPVTLRTTAETETEPWIEPDDISGVRKALLCYRVMAYIVGTLLIVLVCVAMPLKYAAGRPTMVNVVGISHGWLYPVLLITALFVGTQGRLATNPPAHHRFGRNDSVFLSFVAEYFARKDVNCRIDDAKDYWAHHGAPTE